MREPPRVPWKLLEHGGVLLLLLAALVPRVRDFRATFDREFEGWQGAAFSICAVNYERLGVGTFGGYPVLGADVPQDPEKGAYYYPNHPPLVPLVVWASLKLAGPEGWNSAWREGRAPVGIEPVVRLPFLLAHLVGLLVFWWALRQGVGAVEAMLGLALLAVIPVSTLYATLVNLETPSIPCALLGAGFHARWLRHGARRDLIAAASSFALGTCLTFAPVFFVAPLLVQTWRRRGARRGLLETAVVGGAALVPVLAHGLWVRLWLPEHAAESVLARARLLLEPLFDGSAPLGDWLWRQGLRLEHFVTLPLLLCAGAGLLLALVRGTSSKPEQGERLSLALPLFAGGALSLLFFYRHTFDGDTATNGQTTFLLNVAPGLAAMGGLALATLGRPLSRLRAGLAPLVLVVSLVAFPALARTNSIRFHWREPGPRDDPRATQGPSQPLPFTLGHEIAEVLPAGSIGLYPKGIGFNFAVSFYAWRTLLSVDERSFGGAAVLLERIGLADRPRYILLPRDSIPAVDALVARAREELVRNGLGPMAHNAHWEIWPDLP